MTFDWTTFAVGIVTGAVGAGLALRNAIAKEIFSRKCCAYSRLLEAANTFYFRAASGKFDPDAITEARQSLFNAHHAALPFAHPDVVKAAQQVLWLPVDDPTEAHDQGSTLMAILVAAIREDLKVKNIEFTLRILPP